MQEITRDDHAFLAACQIIISHREAPMPNTAEIDRLTSLCLSLVHRIQADSRLVARVVIADLPQVIDALFSAHSSVEMPDNAGPQMGAIRAAALGAGRVDGLIALIERGFIVPHGRTVEGLNRAILDQDSANLFRLFVALHRQNPDFEPGFQGILNNAGLNVATQIATLSEQPQLRFLFAQSIAQGYLDEITLKEFSWMIMAGISPKDHFSSEDMQACLPGCVLDLAGKADSSHGRLALKRIEPSLAMLGARPQDHDFLDLVSPDDHRLATARPIY